MKTLILSQSELRDVITMPECIEWVRQGLEALDLATAAHAFTRARERDLGTWVDLGGLRDV